MLRWIVTNAIESYVEAITLFFLVATLGILEAV